MAKNDVTLKIGADANAAEKSLVKLNKTLLGVAASVATVFAGKKLIDAATQQEKAINAMNQALIRSGDYSVEASQDLQDFASEIQSVTTIGDETTLELLALAKSFGVTNEEAKNLVTTAADASVALGVDARTALEQLGGTLSGTKGRLAKFVPEVAELGVESLKSGEAIDIFAKKFAGAASGELNTFDGALTQTTNILGDLFEELGFFITRSPAVISAVKGIGEVLSGAISFLSDNQGAIRQGIGTVIELLIKGFGIVAKNVLPPVIEAFSLILNISNELTKAIFNLLEAFLGFDIVTDVFNGLYNMVLAIADVVVENLLGAFQAVAKFLGKEIPSIENALTGVRNKIEELAGADAAGSLREFIGEANKLRDTAVGVVDETLKAIQDSAGAIDYDKFAAEFSKRIKGKIDINPKVNTDEAEKSFLDSALQWGKEASSSLANNAVEAAKAFGKNFANIIVAGTKKQSEQQKIVEELELQLASTSDLEERKKIEADITKAQKEQVKAQKQAAEETTKELGGFIGDTLLPGAGQFVKLFLDLAKDPEAFKAFIEGFVDNLPVIIRAMADAIPLVVEVLAENLDKILIALAEGVIRIFFKAIEGVGRFLGVVLENVFNEWVKSLEVIYVEIPNAIINAFKDAGQALINIINDGLSFDIGGGGGGIGGTLGSIGKRLGFNSGGIIPDGYPNDSYPMPNAESGEMVLTERQQARLFDMANGGGAQGGGEPKVFHINLVLNEEVLASQILEINRDNQRIA